MTLAVGEHCLEINVILIYECLTLQCNLNRAGMLYSGHLNVVCTFSCNLKTNGLNYSVKILQNKL